MITTCRRRVVPYTLTFALSRLLWHDEVEVTLAVAAPVRLVAEVQRGVSTARRAVEEQLDVVRLVLVVADGPFKGERVAQHEGAGVLDVEAALRVDATLGGPNESGEA